MLHFAIQPKQIFGGWQKLLKRWDEKGYSIVKPLGYCLMCYSAWLANLSWISFWLIHIIRNGFDYTDGWQWVLWICHWLAYGCIGTMLNLYFIVKLFEPSRIHE